jgi:hypothetical protein
MEYSEVISKQVKLVAAGIGGGAVIAMAALGAVFSQAPGASESVGDGPEITLGETTTEEVGHTEIETSIAVPEVTAEPAPEA